MSVKYLDNWFLKIAKRPLKRFLLVLKVYFLSGFFLAPCEFIFTIKNAFLSDKKDELTLDQERKNMVLSKWHTNGQIAYSQSRIFYFQAGTYFSGFLFSQKSRILERIPMEHVESSFSLDSELLFDYICSIKIHSRNRDINEKTMNLIVLPLIVQNGKGRLLGMIAWIVGVNFGL